MRLVAKTASEQGWSVHAKSNMCPARPVMLMSARTVFLFSVVEIHRFESLSTLFLRTKYVTARTVFLSSTNLFPAILLPHTVCVICCKSHGPPSSPKIILERQVAPASSTCPIHRPPRVHSHAVLGGYYLPVRPRPLVAETSSWLDKVGCGLRT